MSNLLFHKFIELTLLLIDERDNALEVQFIEFFSNNLWAHPQLVVERHPLLFTEAYATVVHRKNTISPQKYVEPFLSIMRIVSEIDIDFFTGVQQKTLEM